MKKRASRIVSLFLVVATLLSLAVPAFAATDTNVIDVSFDGVFSRKYSFEAGKAVTALDLFEVGEREIGQVTISSGSYSDSVTDINGATGTLPNGTKYTLKAVEDKVGIIKVTVTTDALKDDFAIDVETQPASYTIVSNSGAYNTNQNTGSENSPTCVVSDAVLNITGGDSYSVSFTPVTGTEVKYVNIRANYTNATANLIAVDAKTKTATIAGRVFTIALANDGVVTVSCPSATSDMFITALTAAESVKYNLTIDTDSRTTADTTSKTVQSGTTTTIVFTPDSGYAISNITIADGGKTGNITLSKSSVSVNGHTYSVIRKVNGVTTLTVPAASADVLISTATIEADPTLTVVSKTGVTSNYGEISYIPENDNVTVVLTPKTDYELVGFTIETGSSSVYVHADDDFFVIDRVTYRVYRAVSGKLSIYLSPFASNMKITPDVKSLFHTVTLKYDKGIKTAHSDAFNVSDGQNEEVTFIPVDNYVIEQIKITYNGKTYTADVEDDLYLVVNGTRFPITTYSNGRVMIKLTYIEGNMTVTAVSDYVDSNTTYTVKRTADSHSTVTSSKTSVKKGSDVTVTLTPDNKYAISTATVTVGTKSTTVKYGETSFKLNGETYKVSYKTGGIMVIYFEDVTANITVASKTVKESDVSRNEYHEAYMYGIGNGLFAPLDNMTRGEAVTLVVRLFGGASEADVAKHDNKTSSFKDVSKTAWYNSYIVWAEKEGYLDGMRDSRNFRPTDRITRAEFVDLLCRFNNVDTSYTSAYTAFPDVAGHYWAAKQINVATSKGWVKGYPNGTFGAENTITRAEVVAMANRAANRIPDHNTINQNMGSLTYFYDVAWNYWAYYDIMEATNSHFVSNTSVYGETWSSVA